MGNNLQREIIYSDLFDSPYVHKNKYFVLPGREYLIEKYKQREKYSAEKIERASRVIKYLKKIPSIQAIFLTGSVAVGNAKKEADIDLMIVTKPNTLWLTRLLVFIFLKLFKKLKTPICPNIFVDTNYLEISEKNIYTAHEIVQAKCQYDKTNIASLWLKSNRWINEYINKSNHPTPIPNIQLTNDQLEIGNWSLKLLELGFGFIDLCAFIVQYLYMRRKITNERIGLGYAFFHPNNLSKTIPKKFEKRLLKYTSK